MKPFKNDIITVKGTDGQFYQVGKDGLQDALAQGFIVPSNTEIQHQINLDAAAEHPIIAGLESAASAATFGLSRELENLSGLTTPEDQALRQQANPLASGFGTATGIIAPIIATGGLAGPAVAAGEGANVARAGLAAADVLNPVVGATKMGLAAGEAAAPAIQAGVNALVPSTLPRVAGALTRAGEMGVAGATEGALFGLGQSIDEHALGDPQALGEHLVSNVGYGALLGGGLGTIFGGTTGALGSPTAKAVSELDVPLLKTGDFETAIKHSDLPNKDGILSSLGKLKDDAPEIIDIGKRRGYPVLEGQISANKAVQHAEDILLSGQKTYASIGRVELAEQGFKKAAADVENVLKVGADDLSESNIGNRMKQSLTSKVEQEIAPINDLYTELKSKHSLIPLSDRALNAVSKNIGDLQEVRISGKSPVANIARTVMDDLTEGRLKTVDDLRARRIQLSQSLSPMASPAERNIVGEITEKLKNLEDKSIIRFAENDMKTSIAKDKMLSLLEKVKVANEQYKGFITKAQELGAGLGKKRISGAQGLLDFIEEMNPQKIADKIFTDRNVEFTKFMQKNFPEEFEAVRKFKIGQMREEASKKGFLDVKQFTKNLDKLEPEMKALLFNKEDMSVIRDANKYLTSFPESFNPSKTAYAQAFMDAASDPKGMLTANVRDYALEKFVKHSVNMKESAQNQALGLVAKAQLKTRKAIESGVKAAFSTKSMAASVGATIAMTEDEYEKATDKIDQLMSDPESMMATLEKNTQGLSAHAPMTASGVHTSLLKATQFLSTKIPRTPNQKILSPKFKPSKSEVFKFNNYFQTIKHPVNVMHGISHGMVMPEQMETLKIVYPQLLVEMQTAVMEELGDHLNKDKDLPYATKIGLSLFLEQPLVDSMSQESIAMNQIKGDSQGQPDQQNDGSVNPTQGGLANLGQSKRIATNTQSIANGDEA